MDQRPIGTAVDVEYSSRVNNLPLSVAPPRRVALAAATGGETIRENPSPSMGAGKVFPRWRARWRVIAWIARSTTASLSAGCLAVERAGAAQRSVAVARVPTRR